MKAKSKQYVVKVSSQGQLTLPAELRRSLKVAKGQMLTLRPVSVSSLEVDAKLPIEKYKGIIKQGEITGGEDAAKFLRKLRNKDSIRFNRRAR